MDDGLPREHVRDGDDGALLATLEAIAAHYRPAPAPLEPSTVVVLSRFAILRRRPRSNALVVESPLAHARVVLHAPAAARIVASLDGDASLQRLAPAAGLDPSCAVAIAGLLVRAGMAGEPGSLAEDSDPALRQWDFHDLLFHSRSRAGRHDELVGGNYRFLGEIAPQPAVKRAPWPVTIPLPRPDLGAVALRDPPLTTAIELRRSIRLHRAHPIGLARLGEFLFRVARVRSHLDGGDKGELTSRPYPSGGASYELECYAVIGGGAGVAAGMYWYDPVGHGLCLVREPDADTRALLDAAWMSTGGNGRPQILFVLAARFARVSWKYDAIAYATILKNTGVVYSTMYLVATAMGLAPCAVGLGDADLFARAAGTSWAEESSVGEFMLCGAATPP
jgi:oxazoline/thiazoline dehydrogenase